MQEKQMEKELNLQKNRESISSQRKNNYPNRIQGL